MNVLVIEDEPELSQSICSYLSDKDYRCEAAYEYHTALQKIAAADYTCIILDITLPNGNGLDILRALKKERKTDGVLIISARNSVDDKVTGLLTGADDYLTKPFHLSELNARVAAIIRRKSGAASKRIVFDDLVLNTETRVLEGSAAPVDLTPKEYELLLYFLSNKNRVITKEAITEHLWGADFDMNDDYDYLYSHIKNLRKKLAMAGNGELIKAVYGMGYKLSIK